MSQYAVIPANQADGFADIDSYGFRSQTWRPKTLCQTKQSDGGILFSELELCVLFETKDSFSAEQASVIRAVGGQVFQDASEYFAWRTQNLAKNK